MNRIGKDLKDAAPVAFVIFIYYLFVHFLYDAFCPLLILTGIPCAGCGLTRAGIFVCTGQFSRAFYMQPMIFPILIFALYSAYFRYIKGIRIRYFNQILFVLIGCMLIFYVIRMYQHFPDRVPYVYKKDNLFSQWIPEYQGLINRYLIRK